MPKLHEVLAGAQGSMDYGTDALQNDMSASLYNLTLTRYNYEESKTNKTKVHLGPRAREKCLW